jgi:HD-like signal output (HDOD) protein
MVVRVVGSEPALAARLMQIANSAALNFSGKPITELRTAISRMGFNMVRSAAIAFAMSQLKKQDALKGLEKPLEELWKRSAAVAAMSHAVARRYSKINPDTGLLAGLLHGIGQLYILTRSAQHPGLFAKDNTPDLWTSRTSSQSATCSRPSRIIRRPSSSTCTTSPPASE